MNEEQIEMKLKALKEKVEERLGVDAEKIQKEFEEEITRLKDRGMDEKVAKERALVVLTGKYRAELKSTAEFYKGIVIGVDAPRDVLAFAKRTAKEAYEIDPENAVAQGLTDENGTPLDTRATFSNGNPNPNYGKPLGTAIRQNVLILGMGPSDEKPTLYQLSLYERHAGKIKIPMFVPVQFRANLRQTQPFGDAIKLLNPWTRQSFDVIDEDFGEIPDVLLESLANLYAPLSALREWHEKDKEPWEFVVTEGDVEFADPVPNASTGNARIVITDPSMSLDDPGVTVWVPSNQVVDYGPGSHVIVVGRTNINTYNDEERLMINAYGVYPTIKEPLDEATPIVAEEVE